MNVNTELAKKHGAKIMQFKDLPPEARYAIIYYMAIDGEAWEISDEIEKEWDTKLPNNDGSALYWEKVESIAKSMLKKKSCMGFYMNKYGHLKFGYGMLPMSIAKRECVNRMNHYGSPDFETWEEYHKWYTQGDDTVKHTNKNRWACILSTTPDALFEDGWHRFNRYAQIGCRTVPCIFFA